MNSKSKITIPKPCHENWNAMTPKEKGRFCSSCSKTVVDFTKKSASEIKEYLMDKKQERVCGRFYKKQLDSIVIEIPQNTFHQHLSFQKLFVLALFFVMETTLFSCQYKDGKKQKIENVILKDSTLINEEDLELTSVPLKIVDSLKSEQLKDSINKLHKTTISLQTITTIGITVCETDLKKGSLVDLTTDKKSIEIIETVGEVAIQEEEIFMGMIIQDPPKFKEAKNLSKEKAKKDFDKRMKNFVQDNFDISWTNNLGLQKGKYKILTQFKIDKKGNVIDIKVRAPHPKIKEAVVKMMQKLPLFIPAQQGGKAVKTIYSLPIAFIIDDTSVH